MALGLSFDAGGGSGDIIDIVKYDARSGRIFRRDYDGAEYNSVDISRSFKAVVDMENIEVGTIAFGTGAPSFAVAPIGTKPPPAPTPEHKPGARLMIKLGKDCGGDIREIASTAKAFLRGLDELHNAYLAGAIDNPGKLPIVVLADTIGVTTGEGAKKSTNYQPVFEIVGWAPRPADLVFVPRAAPQAPAAAPAARAPATGSKPAVPPPAAPPAADDFG